MTDSKHIVGPTERREEIARIIEPSAWGPIARRAVWWETIQRDALAKADSILASDGEGVTSRPVCLPEGWVAVPREPTEAMLICPVVFEDAPDTTIYFSHAEAGILQRARQMIWKAMLAAAPPLSEPTQDGSPQQASASDGGREMVRELVEAGSILAVDAADFWAYPDSQIVAVDISTRTSLGSDGVLIEHTVEDFRRLAATHAKAKEWLEGKGD